MKYFWGVDCGSAAIKVVVCDEKGKVLKKGKARTLFPLVDHVREAVISVDNKNHPFEKDRENIKSDHLVTLTGYGRHHIAFAQRKLTEIKAHFMGIKQQLKLDDDFTIVDIGGQDSKVVEVHKGSIEKFVMNRKCAAGTGAFIEELANRLELKIEDMTEIAGTHEEKLVLNSYCTVFATQEAIKLLMNGEKVGNLIHALYESVVRRVLEMTPIESDTMVFSGGVSFYHPVLVDIFSRKLKGKKMIVAPDAEYSGAIGAAIYGIEKKTWNE